MSLKNKNILVGVTGSIAAYKAAFFVRMLIQKGANVQVVSTEAANAFITPLTLSTLSKNPVLTTFESSDTGEWNNHVELGIWADLFVIAPLSANTLSKMAHGACDNLLMAVYLSAKCPVYVAPAMDLDMMRHPTTNSNLSILAKNGNQIIEPTHGALASGLEGKGRMAEPESILAILEQHFNTSLPLVGKKALVTAGPTFEPIDPVRFIGNHSSGKMGIAIANQLGAMGATVHLICGPSKQRDLHDNVKRTDVTDSVSMYEAVMTSYASSDINIFAAAVADYKPTTFYDQKVKKSKADMSIALTKTKDIASEAGKLKKDSQINVGFALETENEETNASKKLIKKNLDLIVLNSLNDKGAGFGHDTNKITILDKNNNKVKFELKSKTEVASDIVDFVTQLIHEKGN